MQKLLNKVKAELTEGEEILWYEQGSKEVNFTGMQITCLAFAVFLFTWVMSGWLTLLASSGYEAASAYISNPPKILFLAQAFVFLGLSCLVALNTAKERGNSLYVLTDERAMVCRDSIIADYSYKTLKTARLVNHWNDKKSFVFVPKQSHALMDYKSFRFLGVAGSVCFPFVENSTKIHEVLSRFVPDKLERKLADMTA